MKVLAYVPMLQSDFPPEAFCQDSLSHVVRQCKYFPAYSEVHAHLRAWWREHRPQPPALPPPPPIRQRDEPTDEEKAHVSRIVAELVRDLRAGTQPEEDRQPSGARHLTPAQLDQINPLPEGRKRA
jgi:hypothetical protein